MKTKPELMAVYKFMGDAWKWYKARFDKTDITDDDWEELVRSSDEMFQAHPDVDEKLRSKIIVGLIDDLTRVWKKAA